MHWAHPVTTGSPAIDFFISSEEMEPPGSEAYYSEKLLKLPGVGLYLDHFSNLSESKISEKTDDFRVVSIQSLFKYLPQYDDFYVDLCILIPRAVVYFVELPDSSLTAKFTHRIRGKMLLRAVDPDKHLKVVPRMGRSTLLDFLSNSDVYLDSFGWSGGNTTLDAVEAGCPIYTVPGRYILLS